MSVTRIYRYVCCEVNVFFFDVFINNFPRIYRSVIRKITIDLFETLMTSVYEKGLLSQ